MKSMFATFFVAAAFGVSAEPVKQGLWKKITYETPDMAPVDAVSRTLIRSLTDFTRDPAELERAHAAIGDMIEEL